MTRRWAALFAATLAAAIAPVVAAPVASAADGFTVSAGRLLDANGKDFVMRGVNHAHTWYPQRTPQALKDIKALGANTVRIVLSSGDRWTRNDIDDVSTVVSQCKANRLICVLEVHDTTGYGEQDGAITLARAVEYWLSIKSALVGQERYVIVNIGNEPYGNNANDTWSSDTSSAIRALRAGGLTHTIMVDAPAWGQDWTFAMRDNAQSVFNADSQRNTVFSIHMYGVFDTAAEINDYLGRFVSAKLPIVVGEFGFNHSDGNPDEDTIMATAQNLGLGYLGWSWSGNGGGVEYLDMATGFDATQLTSWGQRIFNGANGIKATSREASVFGSSQSDTTPPSTPGTPVASNVTSSSATLTWSASTDDTSVASYRVVRVGGTAETQVASPTTNSTSITGLSASTTYSFAVYAIDAAGNRSARSATVSVTTPSSGGGGCSVTYKVASQWQGGFQGDVSIRNTAGTAVNGWTLLWAFANGQQVTQMWNATATQSGAQLSARNASWNATIASGASTSLGFTASYNGTNAAPTAFTLNGTSCTVG